MKIKYKIGIDEVGRGPVAGPVAVCVTCFEKDREGELREILVGMNDSKKLTEKKREELFRKIKELKNKKKLFSSVVFVSASDIDRVGIVPAIQKALNRGLKNIFQNKYLEDINHTNSEIKLDGGLRAEEKYQNQETIIKGDEEEFAIAVSSVTAKVLRDRKMKEYGLK